jgi:putative methyltransferase (TIGR04325 family)
MKQADLTARLIPLLQQLVPPGAISLARRSGIYRYGFFGDYASWDDALRASGHGYSDEALAEPIAARTRRFIEEQREEPSRIYAPALAVLAAAGYALQDQRIDRLRVLDFGGSLGVHYHALRRFLANDRPCDWLVCETEMLAREGAARFATDELAFTSDLSRVEGGVNLAITSGTLQCIPNFLEVLRGLLSRSSWVVVDRIPLTSSNRHRASVQRVPPWIYTAQYPSWFFSRDLLLKEIASVADVRMQWVKEESVWYEGETIAFEGLLLQSKANHAA